MSSQGLDHHQSNGVYFFKVILESSLQDGELRVPRSFMRKHWQGMSNPVLLRLPNSTLWKVYWMKRDGYVWFNNGWKEFAEYLSLDVSQFVVFQYEENSSFDVIVFGKSSLEIEYPSKIRCIEDGEQAEESDDCVVILDKREGPTQPLKEKKTNSNGEGKISFKPRFETNGVPSQRTDSKGKRKINEDFDAIQQNVSDSESPNMEHNKFEVSINQCYMKNSPNIPNEFMKRHRRCHEKFVELKVGDMSWDVKIIYYPNRYGRFSAGWSSFVRGCGLKNGDTCLFEMIDKEKLVLKVSISRYLED